MLVYSYFEPDGTYVKLSEPKLVVRWFCEHVLGKPVRAAKRNLADAFDQAMLEVLMGSYRKAKREFELAKFALDQFFNEDAMAMLEM